MTLQGWFELANLVALLGWLPLLARPVLGARAIVAARAAAILLAAGYAAVVVWSLAAGGGARIDYSLAGIVALFAQPAAVLIGWVHYLVFDLWVGAWEAEVAAAERMPHAALLPVLLLTFVAGPVGLLLFVALRRVLARRRART